MRFQIRHQTVYAYSRPIGLAPHTLRFQPRSDGGQLLKAFELHITPRPALLSHTLDAEGNTVARAWFTGQHERLSITSRAVVETTRTNPFDYLLEPGAASWPLSYSDPLRQRLAPALQRSSRAADDEATADVVGAFAAGVGAAAAGVIPFLDELCKTLHTGIEVVHREQGPPHAPAETLRLGRGACRDVAVLFVDACRAVGLAARFVSGYHEPSHDVESKVESETEREQRDIHAWAEVFIPGGGWRAYDPTLGLAVADDHVAVAASADPLDAAPVAGSFHGAAVAAMTTALSIAVAAATPSLPQQQHQLQQ